MKITKEHVGKIFSVKDVPQSEPCLNCTPCLRLRIMEMGIIPGEKIELEKQKTLPGLDWTGLIYVVLGSEFMGGSEFMSPGLGV